MTDEDTITWDYAVPLIFNRFMLWDLGKVLFISLGVMAVLVPIVGLIAEGELSFLPWYVFVIGGGTVAVLFFIAMLLMGNRHYATFEVSPDGVVYAATPRERRKNRIVLLLSFLADDSPTAAGAATLAASREMEAFAWDDIRKVKIHRGPRVVTLMDSWHVICRLYCPPELFERVADLCESYHRAEATEGTEPPTEDDR